MMGLGRFPVLPVWSLGLNWFDFAARLNRPLSCVGEESEQHAAS